MTILAIFLAIALLVAVGFAAFHLSQSQLWRESAGKARAEAEENAAALQQARYAVIQQQSEAAKQREIAESQLRLLTQTSKQVEERFRALASDALQNNSQLFLDRSRDQLQHLVEPVSQSLRKFEEQVQAIEKTRAGAYSEITAQVSALTQLQERVRQSTDQLKTALRSPIQRGRWGEIQLRRVVELAGMLEHCDFAEQKTLFGDTNQRPDLIVHMPNQCMVVVDAKVSLEAYLRAIESEHEADRARHLKDHANQVKTHIRSLGEKSYWQRLPGSPDFVVAFLPLESLFSAALDHDPELLEYGMERRVVVATPTTLITLLLTVSHGWRQSAVLENLDNIRDIGTELYTRLLTMSQHFAKLGDAITKTVETYNNTVGSLEKNVLTSARKFKDLRPANAGQLEEIAVVETATRTLDSGKWPLLAQSGSGGR